jgi:hypothetical protein
VTAHQGANSCCDGLLDAPVTVASPVTLAGVFEIATAPFDDPLNLVLPIPRRVGYYAGILGLSYTRDDGGLPLTTPLHDVRIAFEQLNDAGAAFLGNGKYMLLNRQVRFFSILSDGERSIVPPFVGGGAAPYGLVITSAGVFEQPGTLRAYFRWMPRTNAYPGLIGP